MRTRHERRHSGYVTPKLHYHQPIRPLINECLEPQPHYSDWDDYRDGQRDWFNDRTKLKQIPKFDWSDLYSKRIKWNKRLKYLIRRRKRRQQHPRNRKV